MTDCPPANAAAAKKVRVEGCGTQDFRGQHVLVHPAAALALRAPMALPAATMPVNFSYAPLENRGMRKVAERENSATVKHYIKRTNVKLTAALAERSRLGTSKDRPRHLTGWRPYEKNALKINQCERHLESHKKVLREKLKEEKILDQQNQVASSCDEYEQTVTDTLDAVRLKVKAERVVTEKQAKLNQKEAEYQSHIIARTVDAKVEVIGEKMEEEAPPSQIECWLEPIELVQYANEFESAGYDALHHLEGADEAAMIDMATKIGMPNRQMLRNDDGVISAGSPTLRRS